MKLLLGVAMLVACLSGVAARAGDAFDGAARAGSDRLTNFAATQAMEAAPSPKAMRSFVGTSARLGFDVRDPERGFTGFRNTYTQLRPLGYYDGNANGGNPAERLVLGSGFALTFAPETVASGAAFVGVGFGAGTKLFYGRGRYLDLSGSLGKAWDIEGPFTQTKKALSACSRNHVAGFSYVDFCANWSQTVKALNTSDERRFEASFVQLAMVGGMPAEFRLKAFRQDASGGWNPGLGAEVLAALSAQTSMSFGIENEFAPANVKRIDYNVFAGANTTVLGRPVGFRVSRSLTTGAMILGAAYDDTTTRISVVAPVTSWLSLRLGYRLTKSTLAFYDQNVFDIGFEFKKF